MARKLRDTKTEIAYTAGSYHIEAFLDGDRVLMFTNGSDPPDMTLDQLDKFADKVKQLVQAARDAAEGDS